MTLAHLSIRRPVLAAVMALGLVLFGVLSFTRLSVREYPDIARPVVTVRTVYPGASARLVEMNVTTPLEDVLSGIEGLRTLSSVSREELSQIILEFELGRDLDAASNDVRDRLALVRRQLPTEIEEPLLIKEDAEDDQVLWLALLSDRHSELELTDVAERHVRSRLAVLPGVSQIYIDGQRRYAMRIWLDSDRLTARQLTAQDVEEALRRQNVSLPAGRIESTRREFSVTARGDLQTPEEFNQLILAYREGYPIRLLDVGWAELGAEDDRKLVRVNGKPAVGMGVMKQSRANLLEVARAVKQELPRLDASLPDGMRLHLAIDGSLAIERSIQEVYWAMGLALGLVVLVIYLFLGDLRATLIPAVAIPASIIGAFALLDAWGFSINLLTLLGLVLAVGLVVDDAIVVLENIHRRVEQGLPPRQAALEGSREVGFAVVATTLALVAVFVPILFLRGATGRLFAELALAVAGAVLLSGFIALTLTPMMCATMLDRSARIGPLSHAAAWVFQRLTGLYERGLRRALQARASVVLAGAAALGASVGLAASLPAEWAPFEDTGWFVGTLTGPEGATIGYTDEYARQMESFYAQAPEIRSIYTVVGRGTRPTLVNRAASWASLVDWDTRGRTTQDILVDLAPKLADMTGVVAWVSQPPPLTQSSSKPPVQLVIGGDSYEELDRYARRILQEAERLPSLSHLETDLELNKPELEVRVHRNKAADLGVSMAGLGRTLETLLGGLPVTTFILNGRTYPVIVKMREQDRMTPSDVPVLYVRGNGQEPVQLSNLVTVQETVAPRALTHYDRMRAVTIGAGVGTGFTLGQALDDLESVARRLLPPQARLSYAGESKEFKETVGEFPFTFVLALLVMYLVLAAQFESFVHPFTVLLSVPPAVTGALLSLKLSGGALNLYSQIGMILLIGLVSKNAILLVEFTNQLQARGLDKMAAAVEAGRLRLRPILMTSLATVLGALPLALAEGAGAASRRQLGAVIIGGLLFSTLVTLFLVPVVYTLLARAARPRSEPSHVPGADEQEPTAPAVS